MAEDSPAFLPVLPTQTVPRFEALPSRAESAFVWVQRRLVWISLALLAGGIAASIGTAIVLDSEPGTCYRARSTACENWESTMVVMTVLTVAAWAAFAAALLAWSAQLSALWRRHRLRQEVQPRALSARDWFVRGDLDEPEFRRLEAAYETYGSARYPGAPRKFGAQALLRIALLAGVFAFVFFIGIIETLGSPYSSDAEAFAVITAFAVLFITAVLGAVQGFRLTSQHRRLLQQAREDLRALEQDILGQAHARNRSRATGGPVSAPASPYAPTFQPWTRR